MKIEFKKVAFQRKPFELLFEEGETKIRFNGEFCKIDQKTVVVEGRIEGPLQLTCDRSGEEYVRSINEVLKLKVTDGMFKGFDKDFDVIESYDGYVDFDALLEMEIEAIHNEYHTLEDNEA